MQTLLLNSQIGPKYQKQYIYKIQLEQINREQIDQYDEVEFNQLDFDEHYSPEKKPKLNSQEILREEEISIENQQQQQQQQQIHDKAIIQLSKEEQILNEKLENYKNLLWGSVEKVKQLLQSNNWEQCFKDKKKNLLALKIEGDNDNQIINRGIGIFDVSLEQAKQFLENVSDPEKGKYINKYQKSTELLEKHDKNGIKISLNISSPPIISDMYSAILEGSFIEKSTTTHNDIHIFCGMTIPMPEEHKWKTPKKLKPSTLLYSVWFMEQLDSGRTRLEFVSGVEVDAPGFIRSRIRNSRGPDMIKGVNEYFQKHPNQQ